MFLRHSFVLQETAVVPPKARALLFRFDPRSAYYETLLAPE